MAHNTQGRPDHETTVIIPRDQANAAIEAEVLNPGTLVTAPPAPTSPATPA